MGRAKQKVKVSKKMRNKVKNRQKHSQMNDIEYVIKQAEECMENLDISGAQEYCQRALEINSDHHKALEVTGNMLLEAGQIDEAKQCFGRAIEMHPEEGSSKYMNLGQLLEGTEAMDCLNKGIELLLQERSKLNLLNKKDKAKYSEFNLKISTGYCSLAEIFLTDLCFAENAEESCKTALDKSLEFNSSNPEALQLYASYLMSKNQPSESKEMLKKSLEIWHRNKDVESKQELGATQDDETLDDNLLPFPSRVSAAKLLMEHSMYNTAIEVIEDLIDEDEEEIELWYLSGCCYNFIYQFLNKQGDVQVADDIEDLDTESCEEFISDNFHMALKLTVKLKLPQEEMVEDIHKILTDIGIDVNDAKFNLKKIKSTLQEEQIKALIPDCQPGTSKDDYSFTVSDEEILNELHSDDDDEPHASDNNTRTVNDKDCSEKLSFVYEGEKMEE